MYIHSLPRADEGSGDVVVADHYLKCWLLKVSEHGVTVTVVHTAPQFLFLRSVR
jgi:hypothetical protein